MSGQAFREGAIVDGLTTLVVREGRISKMTVRVYPQDEIWLIDARRCHRRPDDLSMIRVQRLVGNQWANTELSRLIASHSEEPSKATLLYTHGNRTDKDWAIWRGLQFYKNSFGDEASKNPRACRPSVRFVIWSWQSEKADCGLYKDYKIKANRAVVVGRSLARLLSEFPDRRLVLAGFSLGGQSILSALGQPELQSTSAWKRPSQYQVALIAPALDGCYASAQLKQYPDQTLVAGAMIFDNSADRALRVSHLVRRKQCPHGNVPIAQLAAQGNLPLGGLDGVAVGVRDMAREVGKGHSIDRYTRNPTIRSTLNSMLQHVAQ